MMNSHHVPREIDAIAGPVNLALSLWERPVPIVSTKSSAALTTNVLGCGNLGAKVSKALKTNK